MNRDLPSLPQLVALERVDEGGSIAAAARAMNTHASSTLRLIERLEDSLGVRLVDRTSGRLTYEGSLMLAHARPVLDAAREFLRTVTSLERGKTTRIRFGCYPAQLARFGAAAAVASSVGSVIVELTGLDDSSRKEEGHPLASALTAGHLDIAVLPEEQVPARAAMRPLYSSRLVALMRAPRPQISVDELSTLPVAVSPTGHTSRKYVDTAFATAKREPNVVLETASTEALLAVGRVGFATPLLPDDALSEAMFSGRTLTPVPVVSADGEPYQWNYVTARPARESSNTAAVARFEQRLVAAAAELRGRWVN